MGASVTRSLNVARVLLALVGVLFSASASLAQAPDDQALKLAEPDFTLVALPTTLRVPKYKSAFRVTHRFTRPLGDGDFGDLASDLFGIDSGARIGLEYRFGIIPNGQIGIHRTSDKTIEFFAQYGVTRQGPKFPLEVSAFASVEGTDNFQDSKSPTLGAILSRAIGTHAAFYVEPIWVNNSNGLPRNLPTTTTRSSSAWGLGFASDRPCISLRRAPRDPLGSGLVSPTRALPSRSGPAVTCSS